MAAEAATTLLLWQLQRLAVRRRGAHVSDLLALTVHPAVATSRAEAMIEGGLSDDMIRLSVGLEDFDDLRADFETGFRAAAKLAKS